jgi:hypothetical protein
MSRTNRIHLPESIEAHVAEMAKATLRRGFDEVPERGLKHSPSGRGKFYKEKALM